MTYRLFLDDERMPPNDGHEWVIARNINDVIDIIENMGMPDYISFDHDLGENWIVTGTGYHVAKHLVDLDLYTDYKFPEKFSYYVHSQNPVGKKNIETYLDNYLRFKKENS